MHVADGVLSLSVSVVTYIGASYLVLKSTKGISEEEIPKISLLTGAFFVSSLINIPIGPTSVHPILSGFLGLVLGKRAPLGIFIGLILQAALFQHGGISTLGANTLLMSIPALFVYWLSRLLKDYSYFAKGFLAGFLGVTTGVCLLILLLFITDQRYSEGTFSVIKIVVYTYLPLAVLEAFLTAFSVKYLYSIKPSLFHSD